MSQFNMAAMPGEGSFSQANIGLGKILEWATQHYRYRVFSREERIPARPGLLYFVDQGVVRIMGESQCPVQPQTRLPLSARILEDTVLNLISSGQPFEVTSHLYCQLQCVAHVDLTSVIWLYWDDLANWPDLYTNVMEVFRYQHQRLILRFNALGQRRTSDRLLLYIQLLIEDHGHAGPEGDFLSFPLTHAQLANAIGATRVTVTRSMARLRQTRQILISSSGLIGLPRPLQNSLTG